MFFHTRALCALLAMLFAVAAFSADQAPTFQLKLPDKVTYTDTLSMTIKTSGDGQNDTQGFTFASKNVLEKQEGGGYLLDVTVTSYSLDNKAPDEDGPENDPAVMKGMHYVLMIDKDYMVKGYQGDNTPKKWLEKNLPEDKFKELTGKDGQLENVDGDMQSVFVYLPIKTALSGRSMTVGARWFDISKTVVGSAGSIPAYSAWKVLKSEKLNAVDCLRVEQTENTSAKALAKAVKCKEKEITAVGPLETPAEGSPAITTDGKTTYLIDPLTMLTKREETTSKLTIDMNDMLGEPNAKPDPSMILKLDMRILHVIVFE